MTGKGRQAFEGKWKAIRKAREGGLTLKDAWKTHLAEAMSYEQFTRYTKEYESREREKAREKTGGGVASDKIQGWNMAQIGYIAVIGGLAITLLILVWLNL